jgi:Toprim domain
MANRDWNAINNALSSKVVDNDMLEDLLQDLKCYDVQVCKEGRSFRFPCPIHEGQHRNLNMITDGEDLPIRWCCNSKHCELIWKPSLLGFVRGVLSHQYGPRIHPQVAVDYLSRFLEGLPAKSRPGQVVRPRPKPEHKFLHLTRDQVRQQLVIPAPYFLKREYSSAVLERHDVGYSAKIHRAVVPLYDDDGQYCVGFTARSGWPPCDICHKHHHKGFECRYGQVKWKVLDGFPKEEHLYNYHAVRSSPSRCVLVVEGPGDVWRAEEAGYQAVALLGTHLSSVQLRKLKALEKHICLALDNDKAGRNAMARVQDQLRIQGHLHCSIFLVHCPYKDLGDIPTEKVARLLSKQFPTP